MKTQRMPLAYTFNVETPSQLVDIMTEQGVYLPMDISLNQMANIRFVILTRRLHEIPFDIIKIDDFWFIDKVFHQDLSNYLKQGDRLLIINKTMISEQLQESDIFKLILHSSIPFILWVTWDADSYLKYQIHSRQCTNEDAYINAKAYLLKTRYHGDISLYDHLSFVLANFMQNPSVNIGDLFEKFNRNTQYPILQSDLRPPKDDVDLTMVKIHSQLLEGKERYLLKSKDYLIKAIPYLMEMAYYCSSAGYGIHTKEILLIWSAMKRLNNRIDCIEIKFWGKIFGLHCDYYIIQVQHEKEIPFEEIDIINQKRLATGEKLKELIESPWKLSNEVPSESHGTGTNQYTYFVTNSPGLPWIKLPDVTPTMIDHARKIRYLFTGCLSSQVNGFPTFIGLEKDYLRAQIARITATTHVSPAGFYILTETEEEEEAEMNLNDERKDPNIILNPEFNNDPTNPITTELLADTNLQEWVHSQPEILPQGRTRFWRPPSTETTKFDRGEEEDDDDEEISDNPNSNVNIIQTPAPLLQPIGDDKLLHTDQTPWSIGLTMSIMHEYSLCYVRSNVWPGAFTLGHAGNYYNLYVGSGQKYEQYNPSQPPPPATEFAQDLIEENDPTVELENAAEEARRAATAEFSSEEYTSEEEQFTDEEN